MKVSTSNAQNVGVSTYQQQTEEVRRTQQDKSDVRTTKTGRAGDSVQVSDTARLLADADNTARSASEVRQDKVSSLRGQIEDGTYTVDSYRIAENVVKEDMQIFGG